MSRKSNDAVISAWVRLMRAQHAVLSHVETALKREDLPPLVWYDVLLEVGRKPERGLRPFEIEQDMLLPQYGLSRLLGRIEQAGYVKREKCTDDGRGHRIFITPAGQAVADRMWPVYRAAVQKALGDRLTARETAQLDGLLGKLSDPPAQ